MVPIVMGTTAEDVRTSATAHFNCYGGYHPLQISRRERGLSCAAWDGLINSL